jgi:hypothetical protein
VTSDEYQAPAVASWNAGNGRVLCYLGEADGKFSGDFAQWNQAGEFYATLARWIAGKHQPLPDEMLLTQEIRDGVCFVQLHLDPTRNGELFSSLPRVRVLHGLPGAAPAKETLSLAWKNADLLEAAIPIAGRETVLNTIEIAGQQAVLLPPACLPYSPEFAPEQAGRGATALAQIAAATGGQERVEIPKIWHELPVKSRYVELAPWLLVAGAILFLLEIFERRTGWLSRVMVRKPAVAATENEGPETTPPTSLKHPVFPWLVRKPTRTATGSSTVKAPTAESSIDTLRKARERARNRTDKEL